MNNEYTKIINELSSLTLENIHRKNQCDKPFYPLDLLSYLTLTNIRFLEYDNHEKYIIFKNEFYTSLNKLRVDVDNISLWNGITTVLFVIETILENDKIGEMTKDLKVVFNQLYGTFGDSLEVYLKRKNFVFQDLDIVSGVSGVISYLVQSKYYLSTNRKVLQQFLELIVELSCATSDSESSPISNMNNSFIGFSHGEIGLYTMAYKASRLLNDIDSEKKMISMIISILGKRFNNNLLKNFDINALNNSWCHGYAGLIKSYRIIRNSSFVSPKIRSLYDNFVDIYVNNMIHLSKDNFYGSSIICHGLSGLIYEVSLIDYVSYPEEIINYLMRMLMEMYKPDTYVKFTDHYLALEYNRGEIPTDIINGFEGVLLVINSVINKKPYIGDLIFGG